MRSAMRSDHGTVLMFMPAAVLILVVLGALAVDFTAVHLRQRELENAADAAANDAASAAVDQQILRSTGEIVLDPALAKQIVAAAVGARNLPDAAITGAQATDNEITVTLSMNVDYIFGKALGLSGTELTATGAAQLE